MSIIYINTEFLEKRIHILWLCFITLIFIMIFCFNLFGFILLYVLMRFQAALPYNPEGMAAVGPELSFNTAVSFVTNTNWQAYSGEAQLSYFSQMIGLGVQNFVSPAVGLAVLVVLCRGLARQSNDCLGNFWVDITRAVLYGLLPLCLVLAVLLVWQGVPQALDGQVWATTLEGARQQILLGPVASLESIKHIGTNGGGFFGMNAAHPFENPTPLTNAIHILGMLLIPSAMTYAFGSMLLRRRQGWVLFGAAGLLANVVIASAIGRALRAIDEHDREIARRTDDLADVNRILAGRVQRGPWNGWGPRHDD